MQPGCRPRVVLMSSKCRQGVVIMSSRCRPYVVIFDGEIQLKPLKNNNSSCTRGVKYRHLSSFVVIVKLTANKTPTLPAHISPTPTGAPNWTLLASLFTMSKSVEKLEQKKNIYSESQGEVIAVISIPTLFMMSAFGEWSQLIDATLYLKRKDGVSADEAKISLRV